MPEKHRGVIDFIYDEGAFRPLSPSEPFQFFRLFEVDSSSKKTKSFELLDDQKMLVFCTAGKGVVECGNEYTVSPGSVLLSSSDNQIQFSPANADGVLRCICLVFSVFQHDQILYSSELSDPAHFFLENKFLVSEDAIEVHRTMNDFLLELSLSQPTMLLVKGLFYQLLISVYRRFAYHTTLQESESISMHAVGHTVYAIVRYIDDHLFSLNNLMNMAQELGYSYNYLSHLFRKKTGMTIQTYVRKKKIEQSKILLLDPRYSVTEIATMLNYDCIQSFSKAFRKATDMSPSEYRLKNTII